MPPKPIGEISSSVRPRVVILSEAKDLQLRGSRSFADSAAQDDAISPQHLRHDLAGREPSNVMARGGRTDSVAAGDALMISVGTPRASISRARFAMVR